MEKIHNCDTKKSFEHQQFSLLAAGVWWGGGVNYSWTRNMHQILCIISDYFILEMWKFNFIGKMSTRAIMLRTSLQTTILIVSPNTMWSKSEFRLIRSPSPESPENCQAPSPWPYNDLRNLIFHFFEAVWPLNWPKM